MSENLKEAMKDEADAVNVPAELIEKIKVLKEQKDAIILAHYYVDDEVQMIADYVGDSYYLSKIATKTPNKVIIFCGVAFMGESAKILNPEKKVVMADALADCPMAHMADEDKVAAMRERYEDLAVVCYINSTAKLKAVSDVCVTSSNAVDIVGKLPNKNIFFIPDENLGRFVASMLPSKNFILNDGFCHVHTSIKKESVLKAKEARPDALVLAHPECTQDVLDLADYIGSTLGIIEYATSSPAQEFIICTEMGVSYELRKKNPGKKFYSVGHRQFCPNMKRITVDKVIRALETLEPEIELDEELRLKAMIPLMRMHELGN